MKTITLRSRRLVSLSAGAHARTPLKNVIAVTALAASLALSPIPAQAESPTDAGPKATGHFTSQTLATDGQDGFPHYRIPAIAQLNNGDLLVSYDGRPTGIDAPGPNSILQRRSTDGGKTWEKPTVISQGKSKNLKKGYSDPSYVYDEQTGTLFNFHVYSKDTGFFDSAYGNSDANRKVLSATVAKSTDGGKTWTHRSLTKVVKPHNVRAAFATSGSGIQITSGQYKGRLVQQYAGQFRDGTVRAYSVYSDDHGKTWKRGAAVGTNMDENKVVELGDGRLMMNSRTHTKTKGRYVAYSNDGGATWSTPTLDTNLTDPANNASIKRAYPRAEAGTPESQVLLFSNSNNASSRVDGTVRYSCDNGATWSAGKKYQPGSHSYSDLVALRDGSYGVVFESTRHGKNVIEYGSFDQAWLGAHC